MYLTNLPRDKLIKYLKYIVEDYYNISTLYGLKIGYFDYNTSGATRKCIIKALTKLYGELNVEDMYFPGREGGKKLINMSVQAESYGVRCIKYFNIIESDYTTIINNWYEPNLININVLTVVASMVYLDDEMDIQLIEFNTKIENGVYEIMWFDVLTGDIRKDPVYLDQYSSGLEIMGFGYPLVRKNKHIIQILQQYKTLKSVDEYDKKVVIANILNVGKIKGIIDYGGIYDLDRNNFINSKDVIVDTSGKYTETYTYINGKKTYVNKLSNNYYLTYLSKPIKYPAWAIIEILDVLN